MAKLLERQCIVCRDVFDPYRATQILCGVNTKKGECQNKLYTAEGLVVVAYHYALQRQGYRCYWCHQSGLVMQATGAPPDGMSDGVVVATFRRIQAVLLAPWKGLESAVVAGCLPCRQSYYLNLATPSI